MNMRNIGTIYRKEMKDTLRDRRTLIFMLLIPIVAFPLMIMIMSSIIMDVVTKAEEEKAEVLVSGMEHLPPDLSRALSESERINLTPVNERGGTGPIDLVRQGEYLAYLEIPENFAEALESESVTDLEIYYDKAELQSEMAVEKIEGILEPYRDEMVATRLKARDLSPDILKPFNINSENVASAQKVAGRELGSMLPYLIIIMCFMGAMYPAIDLAAGEKERGTLETLLVAPAGRGELVFGKYLVILTTAIVAAVLSMASLVFSLNYMMGNIIGEVASQVLELSISFEMLVLIIMIVLPLAGIFSSIMLCLSIFARSFKEAQSYITAIYMFIILPAFISFLPGIKLDFTMSLIPVVNVSLIIKDAISGTIEWQFVFTAFFSTLILAALALVFAKKWFERESVIFRM